MIDTKVSIPVVSLMWWWWWWNDDDDDVDVDDTDSDDDGDGDGDGDGKVITAIIKCGVKILIHSKSSTAQPLKFGNGWY